MKQSIRFISLILIILLSCLTNLYGQTTTPNTPLTITVNGVSFNMIRVRAGSFMMGATAKDTEAEKDEYPQHEVTITKDFYLAETEMTQALWQAIMGSNPSTDKSNPQAPVFDFMWGDCQEMIAKLNQLTGLSFRLPTEAEWEYAARGGELSKGYKYAGSDNVDEVAWYDKTYMTSVATLKPNELGFYDMSGNVYEWCKDYYNSNAYSSSDHRVDPCQTQSVNGSYCVRGGSNKKVQGVKIKQYCRIANRGHHGPADGSAYFIGVRLAMDVDYCSENNQEFVTYDTICSGEIYEWEGDTYTKPGSYTKTIPNIYGCDSVVTLHLEVLPDPPITFEVNGVSFKMMRVRAGTFIVGATPEQGADVQANEKPAHQVTLTRDYFMSETMLTQALWTAVMGTTIQEEEAKRDGGEAGLGYGDNFPMYCISYNDCLQFIKKLNAITGLTFRMPTEAEWEYAARGGHLSKGYKYPGSNSPDEVAWNIDNTPDKKLHEVKLLKPNELGIYDMAGNVWEYVYDYPRTYTITAQVDPVGDTNVDKAALRGGSTAWDSTYNRVSYRYSSTVTKSSKQSRRAFRLVLDADRVIGDDNQAYQTYDTITYGETYTWHGNTYTKPGSYSDTLTNIYGCDSVVTLHLEVRPEAPVRFEANGVAFNMVRVHAGTFNMGATPEQGKDAKANEKPAHQVTLTKDYLITETELTQALWTAIMGTTIQEEVKRDGSEANIGYGDDYPMYAISYNRCMEFIDSLNKITGLVFRMPTEAEWEYAARGGHLSKGYKYPGSNNPDEVAWTKINSPNADNHPVKQLLPNELGIYDMGGNVWEYVLDNRQKYTAEPQVDPIGQLDSERTRLRGGSTGYGNHSYVRVSSREREMVKTYARSRHGLRFVLDADYVLPEDDENEDTPKDSVPRIPAVLGDSMMFIGADVDSLTEEERYFNPVYLVVAKGKEHLTAQLVRGSICDCDTAVPNRKIGKFSVAKGKQVTFSQGNLQYFPASNLWKFADTQYEYLGNANKYLSPTFRNWVDLFDWQGTSYDWGQNWICGDVPNTWRTLKQDEWEYLLNTRANAEQLKGVAQVNGVNGLVLLSDNWVAPQGIDFQSGFVTYNQQSYTIEQWQKMEQAGTVFLPAAGRKQGNDVIDLCVFGNYWTLTRKSNDYAYYLAFAATVAHVVTLNHISYARSVRLVQDINP